MRDRIADCVAGGSAQQNAIGCVQNGHWMAIGNGTGKGEGKGKNGQGVGSRTGCWNCGGPHYASNYPNPGQTKGGKGKSSGKGNPGNYGGGFPGGKFGGKGRTDSSSYAGKGKGKQNFSSFEDNWSGAAFDIAVFVAWWDGCGMDAAFRFRGFYLEAMFRDVLGAGG